MEETMANIFEKTVRALKFFEHRFPEFDFISRPNLSSFFLFDRYATYLQTLPRETMVEGVRLNAYGYDFPSGCGYTITPDVGRSIIGCARSQYIIDDVSIGKLCHDTKIPIIKREHFDIFDPSNYIEGIEKLKTSNQFHVRTVTTKQDREKDVEVYKILVDTFYK